MAAPRTIPPGGGEILGDAADRRVEILSETDALHATWARFGPGRDGAGHHIHRGHTDLFYVLDGELTIKLADGEAQAPTGTLAIAPPLVVHGFRNAGATDVRYLNLHAPGCGFIDYMRGLRDGRPIDFDQEDPPDEGLRPSSDATITAGELVADGSGVRTTRLAQLDPIAVTRIELDPGTEADVDAAAVYVLDGELEVSGAVRAATGSWVELADPGPATLAAATGTHAAAIAIDLPLGRGRSGG